MSLIQEALKRQQQENDGTAVSSPAAAVPPAVPAKAAPPALRPEKQSTPPPAPQPKQINTSAAAPVSSQVTTASAEQASRTNSQKTDKSKETKSTTGKKTKNNSEEKQTGAFPALIGMILLVIILIAAIGWAVIYGLQYAGIRMPWQPIASEELITSTNSTDNAVSGEVTATVNTQATNMVDASPSIMEAENHSTNSSPADSTLKQSAVAPDIQPDIHPVNSTARTTEAHPTPAPAPVAKVVQPRPKPPVIWPEAKLKGIVGSGRGGAIMLNDMIIGVGEKEKGITVIKIESNGAWLEYKKERRFLKVGKTLE